MPLDRRAELYGFEQVRRRTREDRDAVRRRRELVLEKRGDTLEVALEAFAVRRIRRERLAPRLELLADERMEVILPASVGLRVQVQTDDGVRHRLECGEPIELLV